MKQVYISSGDCVKHPETREILVNIGDLITPEYQQYLIEDVGIDYIRGVVLWAANVEDAVGMMTGIYA